MSLDETKNIVNNDDYNKIIIVKGRIKAVSLNLFGQFIIVFNDKKNIDLFNLVISSFSELYDTIEPHDEWNKYHKIISDTKWRGKFNTSMTNSLMDQIKNLSSTNQVEILYNQAVHFDYKNVDIFIFDLVNRIIHDKNLIIETGIEEVTPDEIKKEQENDNEASEDENNDKPKDETYDDGTIILSCKPILSPVSGKPIYELTISDVIMVKLLPNSERNNHYIDMLKLREGSAIKAIPGTIIDIKSGSGKNDPIEILIEISNGIYGKLLEDEKQVKIKMHSGQINQSDQQKSSDNSGSPRKSEMTNNKQKSSGGLLLILFALVSVLVLLVILIFIFW